MDACKFMFLFCLIVLAPFGEGKIVERVVAVVYDLPILQSDISRFSTNLKRDALIDEAILLLYDRKTLLQDRKEQIAYLIDERILDFEVKKRALEVTFERVEQEIRNISKQRGISRAQLKAALSQNGVTFSDYQNFVKNSIQRQSLIEREVSSKIKISDDDVASYFLAKKGSGRAQVFEYSLAHILFLPQNGGDKGARDRAQQTLLKLKSDGAFDKYAEQYSEDPNFSKGGFLGTFKSGEMLFELENGVRELKEGEISEVIKTRIGYHIVRVNKKTLISDPELEAQREQIRSILFSEAFKKQLRLWLNQRREDAFIKINTTES